jgi:hypothetical protein
MIAISPVRHQNARRFSRVWRVVIILAAISNGCGGDQITPTPPTDDRFWTLDSDADGRLTLEEFLAVRTETQSDRAEQRFRSLDANSDGLLTHDEFARSYWKWWLGAFSALMFVASLIAVPMIVVRLPADYFTHEHRAADWLRSPSVRIEWLLLKNLCGIVLVLGGLAMLVLPGQGVLTILLGFALLDLPGKKRVIAWIVRRPGVLSSINWIRRRRGHPPIREPIHN